MRILDWLIKVLLEEDNAPSARCLIEASIHVSTREKTFNASYRDACGPLAAERGSWAYSDMRKSAPLIGLSERTIRQIEAEVLRKLFLHPDFPTRYMRVTQFLDCGPSS